MSKPNWKYAPSWANFLAMDENEEWHWYEVEPNWSDDESEWLTYGKYEKAVAKPGNGTMESRP